MAAGLMLHHMRQTAVQYDVLLLGGDDQLAPILEWLHMKELIEINTSHHYALTPAGQQAAERLEHHYRTLLTYLDVFAHVDLQQGEFALASYGEFRHEADWHQHLSDERWEDLRIPVIEHLGGDGLELVYLQFVQEQRLDITSAGWQLGLKHGILWDEMVQIYQSALSPQELEYEEESGTVTAAQVLTAISNEGFALLRDLYADDAEIQSALATWYPTLACLAQEQPHPTSKTPVWQQRWEPVAS